MGSIEMKPVALSPELSTEEAFGQILAANFQFMLEWAPIAYEGKDIEGVHQVRVALRRLRSAVVVFRKAIPRTISDPWGEEMRWAAGELGTARDLDVLISEGFAVMKDKIPLPEGEAKLLDIAKAKREQGYERVRAMFDSERYTAFREGFDQWLEQRGWYQADLEGVVREKMRASILRFAVKILGNRFGTVIGAGQDIGTLSTTELHQLRIECKKLRYATEFFTPLFNKKSMSDFNVHLKGLQGILGIMNDVTVTHHLMESLLDGVADHETLLYAGALVGWRSRQYQELRGNLGPAWATFVSAPAPWVLNR
ncbi:MAG: CHAD domain-containing protein [Magnetococcales bacterium]|nr:CHAD domain-containing protein [Magnetococcales bacterium]